MCGLIGSVERGEARFDVSKALGAIRHRGPDASGVAQLQLAGSSIQLGHSRLSIIDVASRSDQPMWSSDKERVVVFNGEIYNFRELKAEMAKCGKAFVTDSDTEVLLAAYEHYGPGFVSRLVGMYAFCLIDVKRELLFLVRDRMGVKPLYFSSGDRELIFSSDMRGILRGKRKRFEIDQVALDHFLLYGYTSEDASILSGINKISPGTFLKLDLRSWSTEVCEYSDGDDDILFDFDDPRAKETLRDVVVNAVQRRLVSDVQVGGFLSGGYDSSLVAAIAKCELGVSLPAFTIGFEDSRFDESTYAARVAEHLGLEHYVEVCSALDAQEMISDLPRIYDEPFGDSSAIPTALLSRFTRRFVKVALGADGGDELFGGYRKYFNAIRLVQLHRRYPWLRLCAFEFFGTPLAASLPSGLINADLNGEVYRKVLKIIRERAGPALASDIIERSVTSQVQLGVLGRCRSSYSTGDRLRNAAEIYTRNEFTAMRDLDFRYYLPSDILVKVDRASMSYGLEAREPLLDVDLIRLSRSVPERQLYNAKQGKFLLKELCHRYVPKDVMERPKMGFGVPVRDWMRADLKALFDNEFFGDSAIDDEFDVSKLRCIVRDYYSGKNDYFNYLWYVFNFSRWKRNIQ